MMLRAYCLFGIAALMGAMPFTARLLGADKPFVSAHSDTTSIFIAAIVLLFCVS